MEASDQTLDLVEQEIRRAEALLAHDIMQVDDDWSPGTNGRVAPNEPRINEARRRELLANLAAERRGDAPPAAAAAAAVATKQPETPASRHSSSMATAPAFTSDTTASTANVLRTAPTPGGTERDVLISRLLAEREAKLKAERVRAAAPLAQPTPSRQQQQQQVEEHSVPTNVHVRRSGSVVITQGTDVSRPAATPQAPTSSSQPRPIVPTPQQHPIMNMGTPSSSRSVRFAGNSQSATPSSSSSMSKSMQMSKRKFSSSSSASSTASNVPESPMRWASSTKSRRFSRRTKEDVIREAEARDKKACTFQPKINKKGRYSQTTNLTRKERLRRLSTSHETKERNLAKERSRIQEKEMKECTFQPKINKSKKSNGTSSTTINTREGIERLHRDADQRSISRQKLKLKIQNDELESYPFKPSINRKSEEMLDMSHYKPIHLRVNDIQRAKHASRLAERLSRDASNPNLTFTPKINETSKQLIESKRMETTDPSQFDVTSRLMKDAKDSTKRTLKRQQEYALSKQQELSFQPNISATSRDIVSTNSDFMGPNGTNFVKRQEMLMKKKINQRNVTIKNNMLRSECTFKPNVGSATEVLRHTRPHRLNESNLERIERLSKQDVQNKQQKMKILQKRYFEKNCTFAPKINEISKSLAKSKTVQELTDNRKSRQMKHDIAVRREEELKRQCTFQPKVNTSKKAKEIVQNLPASQYRVNVNEPTKIVKAIATYKKDRETKLRQTRQEVEYEAMKECTFAPDTGGHKVPKSSGPVVVRGLGRYLELKDLAKRLENEKKEREQKAYFVRGASKSTKTQRGATIPKPFNLTKRRGKENARREKLAEDIRRQQMSECTFHPKTTEARNRELIQQILDDDSLFEEEDL